MFEVFLLASTWLGSFLQCRGRSTVCSAQEVSTRRLFTFQPELCMSIKLNMQTINCLCPTSERSWQLRPAVPVTFFSMSLFIFGLVNKGEKKSRKKKLTQDASCRENPRDGPRAWIGDSEISRSWWDFRAEFPQNHRYSRRNKNQSWSRSQQSQIESSKCRLEVKRNGKLFIVRPSRAFINRLESE